MEHFPSIHTPPHQVTITTEQDTRTLAGADVLSFDDVTLTFSDGKIALRAADTPLCTLRLRWNLPIPTPCRLLGDVWERNYAAMEWRGMVAERTMPWYFLANTDHVVAGYGVKTNPDAFCCFTCDPKGITLYLDVRCGGPPYINF